jgi:phage shock protein A
LNWYKLAAEAILAIGLVTGAYFSGVYHCEMKNEHKQVTTAIKQVKAIKADVEKRVPQTQRLDRKAERQAADVKVTGEKLHESLAKTTTANGCTFSDEQLQLFRKLADATRSK